MQNIPIALATPGMVLAREVANPQRPAGPVLFGRGAAVSDVALERMRKMGVVTITVEGRPLQVDGEDSLEQQLDKLARRFRGVEGDAFMMDIKRIMGTQIRRTLGE